MDQWLTELDQVYARIAGRFTRAEPRRRARLYLSGLVAGPARKNGWTLAEQAGDISPDGMQRLLRSADWDVDKVRDDVRDYVIEKLGDRPGALIAGAAGFSKKGVRSAGVARQFSPTTGRIENCQVGLFVAYRTDAGQALIDRQLYLPREWTDDRVRRQAAGIGDGVTFASKDEIVERMLERVLAAGVRPSRVVVDNAALRESVQQARDQAGLDQYQVRDWRAWHAHITLSMAAYAWLVVTRALEPPD